MPRSDAYVKGPPASPPPPPPPPPGTDAVAMDPEVLRQRDKDIWTVMLGLRAFNALTLATFFQPDEYYQALEPAWKIAFGGERVEDGPWITWEWNHQLRSSLYPYVISIIYRIVAGASSLLGFPPPVQAQLLNWLPAIFMAFVAALMEHSTWRLAQKVYGKASIESWAVIAMLLLSPWQWFVSTRTLSNGVEASLTATAMSFWPWALLDARAKEEERKKDLTNLKYSLVLASVACVLRPTNVLIWLILATYTILKVNLDELIAMVRDAGIYGPLVLVVTGAVDRLYYGFWVFPPAKWLHYNLTQNLAVFYGVNRPDYYFTEGLPLLLTTTTPFAVIGIIKCIITFISTPPGQATIPAQSNPAILRPLAAVVLVSITTLSLISHKEVRFIHPLLPALTILAARPLTSFFAPFPNPPQLWKKALLTTLIAINISLAVYAGYFHNRGVIDVVHYLRKTFETTNYELLIVGETPDPKHSPYLNVGFLMPCHSTPWRSHLVHPGIDAWALSCDPPIRVSPEQRAHYRDEADQFYADPAAWLRMTMTPMDPPRPWIENRWDLKFGMTDWPQYLVFFEQLIKGGVDGIPESGEDVRGILESKGYEECWRGWNSHWHDDWRRTGDVLAYCIKPAVDVEAGSMWEANHGRWATA